MDEQPYGPIVRPEFYRGLLTLSLFPTAGVFTRPNSYPWTKMRLLAGHLLLFDQHGVTPVFCELHAPLDETTSLAAYEDSSCKCLLVSLTIDTGLLEIT